MKGIAVCQPYADLIMLPASDPRHKRVENRTWPTTYRGSLAIHAGKNRNWIEPDADAPGRDSYGFEIDKLTFGAILGVVRLQGCVELAELRRGKGVIQRNGKPINLAWMLEHQHTEGPWCWVLMEVRRLVNPLPFRGAQGLFDVPDAVLSGPFVEQEA